MDGLKTSFSLLLFVLLSLQVCSFASALKSCPPSENLALLHFKTFFSVNKNASHNNKCNCSSEVISPKIESWKEGTDCCSWDGVICDASTGNVIHLDLSCDWLYGNFPSNTTLFLDLPHLHTLDLAFNDFLGTQFSSQLIGQVMNLTHLNLSCSNFSGIISPEISSLFKLISFDISHNSLSLNGFDFEMMSKNLTRIQSLSLDEVNMSLVAPISFLSLSPTLVSLSLSSCEMQGNFPTNVFHLPYLKQLNLSNNPSLIINSNWSSSLELLDLSSCDLQGQVPTSMFHLLNLTTLSLSFNKMNGTIPAWLFSMPSLKYLDLGNNQFTGEIPPFHSKSLESICLEKNMLHGPIPKSIFELPNLTTLSLSSNNLTGVVELGMFREESLKFLNLSHNLLTRVEQLPWKNLQILDLRSNKLQGSIPNLPPNLIWLSISNNSFSGEISLMICNLSSLLFLDLSYNMLSGTIPSCLGNLSNNLWVLNLRKNKFNGTIPSSFSKGCYLRKLNLEGNQLEGSLPHSLGNCKHLRVLDLGSNMFTDTFPKWLESFLEIQILSLRSNKFHGALPDLKMNGSFSELLMFDLSNNTFDGPLPTNYMKNFKAMMKVGSNNISARAYLGETSFVFSYDYCVTIMYRGSTLEMQKIFHALITIDLSNNNFEGEIPEDVGNFHSLVALNLSHNHLNGSIPPSMGNLTQLQWLDLSSNMLVGEIPWQLLYLTFLGFLNLSQNQLTGPIPVGKQFNTFPIDSYRGNLGLCGPPLPMRCQDDDLQPPIGSTFPQEDNTSFFNNGFSRQVVLIGYGFGMVIGIAMGCIMFQIGKPRWLLVMIEQKQQWMTTRINLERHHARRNFLDADYLLSAYIFLLYCL